MQERLNWLPWKGSVLARVPWVRIPLSPPLIIYFQSTMYFVYVLFSNKLNKRYVGSTQDVDRRLTEHNLGKSKFTSSGIPWELIHKESFSTNAEARRREMFLKSGVGRKLLDQILK